MKSLHRVAEKPPQITVSSFLPFAKMVKKSRFSRDFGFFVVICDFAYMVGIKNEPFISCLLHFAVKYGKIEIQSQGRRDTDEKREYGRKEKIRKPADRIA